MLRIQIESAVAGIDGSETIMTTGGATIGNLIAGFIYERRLRPEVVTDFSLQDSKGNFLKNHRLVDSYALSDGDKLYLTKREPGKLFGCGNWFALAALAFTVSVVGFAIGIYLYMKAEPYPFDYVVVLDAGSTHTDLYIYQWAGDKFRGTGLVDQKAFVKCEGTGIANYPTGRDAARSLNSCLNYSAEQLPRVSLSSTEIYLGATAGMRILNETNSNLSAAIMDAVSMEISGNYPFKYDPTNIRILTGQEEGAFGWIAANFLVKSIPSSVESADGATFGALDLGGASAQVTFQPANTSALIPNSTFRANLFGEEFVVYSESYICYGMREAERRFKAKLVIAANDTTILNPCMPTGNSSQEDSDALFGHFCTKDLNFTGSHVSLLFKGASNSTECRANVKTLFNTTECTYPDEQCSFDDVFQPPLASDFMAFAGFYYIMEFLNLTNSSTHDGQVALTDFRQRTFDFCQKNWTEINTLNASDPHNPYLATYCFEAQFVDAILTDGFHYNDSTFDKIHFTKDVNGKSVGWSLGLALNATNAHPVESRGHLLSTSVFACLMVLFGFLTILSVILLVRTVRIARRYRNYEPISTYGAI